MPRTRVTTIRIYHDDLPRLGRATLELLRRQGVADPRTAITRLPNSERLRIVLDAATAARPRRRGRHR